jgi:GTP-binding protein
MGLSAHNDRNIDQVIDAIRKNVDLTNAPHEVPDPEMLVAIVGKRNAGKSTLVNAIAEVYEGHGDRVIVSEIPGTTRDSVDVRFEKDGKALTVIDTAGVRKKRHMMTDDIEFYSFHRAQRSIRRADVVMMLIDGAEPVSEPDKKLAQYIFEQKKPVLLVVNKWDLVRDKIRGQHKARDDKPVQVDDSDLMAKFREYLDQEIKNLDFSPIAFVTAKDKKNVQTVIDLCQHLFNQASERVGTGRLNTAIRQILQEQQPSTPGGRRARIYYATQTDVAPPTIVLFVNKVEYFHETYQRFIINRFRELLPYAEVPINLVIRPRERKEPGALAIDDVSTDSPESLNPRPARPVKPRPRAKVVKGQRPGRKR